MSQIFRLYLFKVVLKIVQKIPLKLLPLMNLILTELMYAFAKKDRAILEKNIHQIFNLPSHSNFSKSFAKQVFRHQITSALESIKGIENPDLITIDGYAELQEAMSKLESCSQGKIYFTAHIGSWELNGMYAGMASQKDFYALAKPMKIKRISQFLENMRAKGGIKVLWTDQASLYKSMLKVMQTGQWLSFVMDQKPDNRVGSDVQFFGQNTTFVNGPATMAIKYKAPVLAVFCVRVGSFHYRLMCNQILPANHQETDQVKVCQLMAQEIERVIRLYPEQWCWNYKRWKFDANK